MFLEYLALAIILIVLVILFYVFIYIHELPYEAAKHRNHPHQDAIFVACWLSLFTLHAIWPLVFIWAMAHQGSSGHSAETSAPHGNDLAGKLKSLENRLQKLEDQQSAPANKSSRT